MAVHPRAGTQPRLARRWRESARLAPSKSPSASTFAASTTSARVCARPACLPMLRNFRWRRLLPLDLDATARAFAAGPDAPPELRFDDHDDPMQLVHDQMFRSAVPAAPPGARLGEVRSRRLCPAPRDDRPGSPPHARLPASQRQGRPDRLGSQPHPVRPCRRLDRYAPYCIEHGGQVLNVRRRPQRPAPHPGLCQTLRPPGAGHALHWTSASKSASAPTPSWTPSPARQPLCPGPRPPSPLAGFLPRFTRRAAFLRWSSSSKSSAAASNSPSSPLSPKAPASAPAAFSRRPCWPRSAICAA